MIKGSRNLPGPSTIEALKVIWKVAINTEAAFNLIIEICEKYPNGCLWYGPQLLICISNPKDIEVRLII
ncbi:hypothetical protein PV326_000139 [Microctonus aethiopoides]|nr:hypothetical protein PV326_000139 [Microctonus aethiopoides]